MPNDTDPRAQRFQENLECQANERDDNHAAARVHSAVIVGGGPAGTALLTAATKQNKLAALARAGLVVVERDDAIGGGRLGRYAITSDSTAVTFLSAVKDNVHKPLAEMMNHPSAQEIARYTDALGVPLVHAGPFLLETGQRLHALVEESGGTVLTGHEAIEARQLPEGLWQVHLRRRADESERILLTRNVIIATGGHQPVERLQNERFAGVSLVERAGDRLVQSDDVLKLGGVDKIRQRLAGKKNPRIAIIGGSTSALGTANLLLKAAPALPLDSGAITVLHRRPLRPFYPSAEAAHADGFTDFGPDDICPLSGFVYRLAGFRLEARELLLRMLQIGGRQPESRLQLQQVSDMHDPAALDMLDQADLVIAALGYRPYGLPLFDPKNEPIALAAHGPGRPAMVDGLCRVLDANRQAIPNLYGIGLSAGFVPSGTLGGEPSFAGQANGLWLWQNDVGLLIVDQLLNERVSTTQPSQSSEMA